MQKNDHFQIKITDCGVGGEGIGKYDGMTFFIKDAVIGDTIEAAVTKLKKNYGYARLVKVLEASSDRVAEACPLAKRCGGCQLQAYSYEAQLDFKTNKVRNNLIRLGGFEADFIDSVMEPIIGMDEPYRYRNKAQFPFGVSSGGDIVCGFYEARSHRVVDIDDCILGRSVNTDIINVIKAYMEKYHIEPYDEVTGKGLIRHALIRCGFKSGEIMICLVINGADIPEKQALIDSLTGIEGMTSICLNSNTKKTNVILGDSTKTIWGRDTIRDSIGGIAFEISARSFYQVNPVQTEKLYGQALEYAGLTGEETVWDLYCGIGTISLFLAGKAKKVYGVEIVPEAIEDAKRNAQINGIDNAEFFAGKAEEVLPEFYEAESGKRGGDEGGYKYVSGGSSDSLHPDVIVVDPPRKGCDERCLETMVKMSPSRIVYVSCDSATLARDLKYLAGSGYEIEKVRPVDQFPQTEHVETVCLLSKLSEAKHSIDVKLNMDELDVTTADK